MGTICLCSSPLHCFLLFFPSRRSRVRSLASSHMCLFLSQRPIYYLLSSLCTCNLGNSLAANALASFVSVLGYITVQSSSLNHWHLETMHCFTITGSRWVLNELTVDLWPKVAKTKRLGKAGGCNPLKAHINLLLTFSHRLSLCLSAWTLYVRGKSQRPNRWWELFVKALRGFTLILTETRCILLTQRLYKT